jgi:hypothetical protein
MSFNAGSGNAAGIFITTNKEVGWYLGLNKVSGRNGISV